jgi:hypothetical protein
VLARRRVELDAAREDLNEEAKQARLRQHQGICCTVSGTSLSFENPARGPHPLTPWYWLEAGSLRVRKWALGILRRLMILFLSLIVVHGFVRRRDHFFN